MKPIAIHRIANTMDISWDGDKNFMDWCETIVGKRHLDDMSEPELIMIYIRLKNGKFPQYLIKNG